MDSEKNSLAARIRAARIGIGMSQTELAQKLDVNRATVGHWERKNGFAPSIDHLYAMSSVMRVSPNWLFHGEDRPQSPEAGGVRAGLESKMLSLSKHLPVSFLASVVALLENAENYL
ncbi:helix-turn-helix transcriptional regulator [Xanthomonas campestris pv. papavericola]|uniref:Helix-turn-helix transcriptional regulator n=2 Tax=Xanthomonas campestris TaxID=339 RepID=A0AAJ2X658_XANCA|nr:helix-turn-helix transcriptional regulator [Xanthomonas campestris]MEC3890126.1 helix-turn-helix transcriptional regulator [Xanthomonas campestris pv. papavericola]